MDSRKRMVLEMPASSATIGGGGGGGGGRGRNSANGPLSLTPNTSNLHSSITHSDHVGINQASRVGGAGMSQTSVSSMRFNTSTTTGNRRLGTSTRSGGHTSFIGGSGGVAGASASGSGLPPGTTVARSSATTAELKTAHKSRKKITIRFAHLLAFITPFFIFLAISMSFYSQSSFYNRTFEASRYDLISSDTLHYTEEFEQSLHFIEKSAEKMRAHLNMAPVSSMGQTLKKAVVENTAQNTLLPLREHIAASLRIMNSAQIFSNTRRHHFEVDVQGLFTSLAEGVFVALYSTEKAGQVLDAFPAAKQLEICESLLKDKNTTTGTTVATGTKASDCFHMMPCVDADVGGPRYILSWGEFRTSSLDNPRPHQIVRLLNISHTSKIEDIIAANAHNTIKNEFEMALLTPASAGFDARQASIGPDVPRPSFFDAESVFTASSLVDFHNDVEGSTLYQACKGDPSKFGTTSASSSTTTTNGDDPSFINQCITARATEHVGGAAVFVMYDVTSYTAKHGTGYQKTTSAPTTMSPSMTMGATPRRVATKSTDSIDEVLARAHTTGACWANSELLLLSSSDGEVVQAEKFSGKSTRMVKGSVCASIHLSAGDFACFRNSSFDTRLYVRCYGTPTDSITSPSTILLAVMMVALVVAIVGAPVAMFIGGRMISPVSVWLGIPVFGSIKSVLLQRRQALQNLKQSVVLDKSANRLAGSGLGGSMHKTQSSMARRLLHPQRGPMSVTSATTSGGIGFGAGDSRSDVSPLGHNRVPTRVDMEMASAHSSITDSYTNTIQAARQRRLGGGASGHPRHHQQRETVSATATATLNESTNLQNQSSISQTPICEERNWLNEAVSRFKWPRDIVSLIDARGKLYEEIENANDYVRAAIVNNDEYVIQAVAKAHQRSLAVSGRVSAMIEQFAMHPAASIATMGGSITTAGASSSFSALRNGGAGNEASFNRSYVGGSITNPLAASITQHTSMAQSVASLTGTGNSSTMHMVSGGKANGSGINVFRNRLGIIINVRLVFQHRHSNDQTFESVAGNVIQALKTIGDAAHDCNGDIVACPFMGMVVGFNCYRACDMPAAKAKEFIDTILKDTDAMDSQLELLVGGAMGVIFSGLMGDNLHSNGVVLGEAIEMAEAFVNLAMASAFLPTITGKVLMTSALADAISSLKGCSKSALCCDVVSLQPDVGLRATVNDQVYLYGGQGSFKGTNVDKVTEVAKLLQRGEVTTALTLIQRLLDNPSYGEAAESRVDIGAIATSISGPRSVAPVGGAGSGASSSTNPTVVPPSGSPPGTGSGAGGGNLSSESVVLMVLHRWQSVAKMCLQNKITSYYHHTRSTWSDVERIDKLVMSKEEALKKAAAKREEELLAITCDDDGNHSRASSVAAPPLRPDVATGGAEPQAHRQKEPEDELLGRSETSRGNDELSPPDSPDDKLLPPSDAMALPTLLNDQCDNDGFVAFSGDTTTSTAPPPEASTQEAPPHLETRRSVELSSHSKSKSHSNSSGSGGSGGHGSSGNNSLNQSRSSSAGRLMRSSSARDRPSLPPLPAAPLAPHGSRTAARPPSFSEMMHR